MARLPTSIRAGLGRRQLRSLVPEPRGWEQHLRCGFLLSSRRSQVSLATVLERTNNVLPCYAILQQQLQPQIVEEPSMCDKSPNFLHSISWSWNGKELAHTGSHRSKRGAKNEAARFLLQQLAAQEAELMDPGKNGALAQWAIGSINQRLEASLELQEEQQEADEPGQGERQRRLLSHTCTWTCPQVEGEFVATGSAHAAAESRQQAMSALYKVLPSSLEELFVKAVSSSSSSSPTGETAPRGSSTARDRARIGEVNVMHNTVVQKMGIQAVSSDVKLPSGEFEWTLTWNFWCMQQGAPRTEKAVGLGKSKAEAKTKATEQMLLAQGHLQNLSAEQLAAVDEVKQALKEFRVLDAATKAVAFMETSGADASSWSLFLPEVLRGVLAEGDSGTLNELLVCALRGVQEQGSPVELWESLLDEASFAIRHYYMASAALEQLSRFPLADVFPSNLEKDYFKRFRYLLALERHGSLMHGIQQYELDSTATSSVPAVEVHHKEASMVVLTSSPGSGIMDLVDGARTLRGSDIVLLVPSEAVNASFGSQTAFPSEGMEDSRRAHWQHPEAWLASITKVQGNPRFGEEVMLHTRRISSFSSDVEGPSAEESSGAPRASPIPLGRQFRLFYISMETPLSRQLAAMRCLCQPRLPAWSEGFEGRKPTYSYSEAMRRVLLGEPEEARVSALEPLRSMMGAQGVEGVLERLGANRSWLAALTPSQHGAVSRALEQRLSVVQGPPGTGKTFVACAIVAAWADIYGPLGQRILAVADSNVAADNLHTRLQHFGIESVRAGQGKDAENRPGDMMWKAAQSAKVVVATCIGSGMDILNSKGEGGYFHRVIVDECTQACEPAVLVPLGRRCEQVVLIGDHKQLPATVLSKLAQREGLGISLFERMVHTNGLETTFLTEQRRMHSSIAEFPNMAFYDGQLVNAADDNALTAVPGFPWPNPECRVSFVDVSSSQGAGVEGRRGFSPYNVGEADAVARTLQAVIRAGYPPQQIVVLTAYLAQKHEIIRAIRDRGLDSYLVPGAISVDTVDAYQGMEQGLVLFSATRNNEAGTLGFLADARRMNVMLTRAKQGLIIFGDGNTLRNSQAMESRWPAWLDWVEQKGAVIASRDLDAGLAAAQSSPAVASTSQGFQGSVPAFAPLPPSGAASVWQQVHSEAHGAHYYWNKDARQTLPSTEFFNR
ncbi:unnamed protein product [Polarella glacialis]|uniref:RNA helicase n=1 Tax=Polarella glacialis TaxID=89957 RepID=A0A813K2J9_POLGL|nr:unnamed protein product [Polarella glacialis]